MMNGLEGTKENLVLGIDIGTRNVVGTVGYRTDEGKFVVYDEDEFRNYLAQSDQQMT